MLDAIGSLDISLEDYEEPERECWKRGFDMELVTFILRESVYDNMSI
jgi:hypothetical protein